jgi:YfiH family protein
MTLDLIKPKIFPEKIIISGVTTAKNDITFSYDNSKEKIIQNKIYLVDYLQSSLNHLIFQKQIHSNIIKFINNESMTATVSDAMITPKKGIVLNVLLADCLGILIYDMHNQIIAAVHSGWRGTRKQIVLKTLEKMKTINTADNCNYLVYLTPCAGSDRYEVEYDVAQYFPNHVKKISESKYLFDNRLKVYDDLVNYGIPESNIENSNLCTISDTNLHSYRRDKENAGRMTAFIGIL